MPDAVLVVGHDGVCLDAHIPSTLHDAFAARQVRGRHLEDLWPADVASQWRTGLERALRSGTLSTVDYALGAGSDARVYEARLTPRTATSVVAIVRERTAARRAEREARERSDAAIRELQADLAQLAPVAALGIAAGSVAHEINQPLMAIQANADAAALLLEAPAPDVAEIREALDDVSRSNRQVAQIARRLLTPLEPGAFMQRAVNINALITESLRLVRRQLDDDVAIELLLSPLLPDVLGDRVQLQQVLLNVLLNAADAVRHPDLLQRRITVRTERSGHEIIVSIGDTGIGVPAGDESRIFEPFYTTKPHGLGLGLVISRTIMMLHGGRLRAERNELGGLTLSFTLQAADAGRTRAASRAVP